MRSQTIWAAGLSAAAITLFGTLPASAVPG